MTSTTIEAVSPADGDRAGMGATAKGFAWSFLSVAILSGWFVVTRLGFRHDLRVWDIIALRFGEGALLLAPTLLFGRSRLPLRAWLPGILPAILWGAPFIVFVGTGLQLTSAALASAIAPALMPVFAGMIGWLIFGEMPRGLQISGYVLIAAGLVVLILGYTSAQSRLNLIGVLALVVAAAMWAACTLRLRGSGLSPLQATALICFWSAISYVPIYVASGLSNLAQASASELLFQSLYQGLLMSVVAIFAFNRAVASLGPKAATAIIALVPVAATLFAIPVLNEFPSSTTSVAIVVIACGVMLAAGSVQSKKFDQKKGEDA
ncbi:DMT family transporter [Bradyrhizobium genosp. P]|uniref:DMT family transporter n=1 Tax=Bradyrhizobium genosp. P TaxID=83641 RepID=UPI003CEC38DB